MTRHDRLMATLRGQPVDRPPVCFYELDGIIQNPADPDPFNIYSHPSWKPLLDLTWEKSDCIHRRHVPFLNAPPDPCAELTTVKTEIDASGNRLTTVTIRAGKRTLTSRHLREPDIDTVWTTEHLVKDIDDFRAWLDLPSAPVAANRRPRLSWRPRRAWAITASSWSTWPTRSAAWRRCFPWKSLP